MTDMNIQRALHGAVRELGDAIRQRDQLNVTIVQLQSKVRSLQAALTTDALVARQQQAEQAVVGLTEAIRSVFRLSGKPMTAPEVKNALTVMGFNFAGFSNPSAAIHNTLKRMASTGELVDLGGKTFRFPRAFYGE